MRTYFIFYYLFSALGVAFLATVYGSIIHFILHQLTKKRWSRLYTCGVVFLGLFIWQQTYWGKKSGPEYERIPVGNQLEIRKWAEEPYVADIADEQAKTLIRTQNFIRTDSAIYGESADKAAKPYFVFHIPSRQLVSYTGEEYNQKVKQEGYPAREQFASYRENWESYWGNKWVALLY